MLLYYINFKSEITVVIGWLLGETVSTVTNTRLVFSGAMLAER